MELRLAEGAELQTFVNVESPFIPSCRVRIFLEFLEFLNQYSFRSDFTITSQTSDIKIIKQTIRIKKPISGHTLFQTLGEVKIFKDDAFEDSFRLPSARLEASSTNLTESLDIRVIIDRPKSRVHFRTRPESQPTD